MPPLKNDDTSSLSHTKWNCQYHIVFTPKYRRKAIFAKLRSDIGKYLRRLCEYKGVEIVETHAMPDHIHIARQDTTKDGGIFIHGIFEGQK